MKLEAKVEQFKASVDRDNEYFTGLVVKVTYFSEEVTVNLSMATAWYSQMMKKGIDPTGFFRLIEDKINAS